MELYGLVELRTRTAGAVDVSDSKCFKGFVCAPCTGACTGTVTVSVHGMCRGESLHTVGRKEGKRKVIMGKK